MKLPPRKYRASALYTDGSKDVIELRFPWPGWWVALIVLQAGRRASRHGVRRFRNGLVVTPGPDGSIEMEKPREC